MGFLRIHCDYCGGTWDVYGRDDWKNTRSRTCPHCMTKIDGQDWNNQIVPAFATMQDANRELLKTHTGYNAPLFTVDYIEDHYFPDAARAAETAVFNLETRIEELRDVVEDMTEAVGTMAAAIITTMKEGENDV